LVNRARGLEKTSFNGREKIGHHTKRGDAKEICGKKKKRRGLPQNTKSKFQIGGAQSGAKEKKGRDKFMLVHPMKRTGGRVASWVKAKNGSAEKKRGGVCTPGSPHSGRGKKGD